MSEKIRDLAKEVDTERGYNRLGGYEGCEPYQGDDDVVVHKGLYDNTIGKDFDSDDDIHGGKY